MSKFLTVALLLMFLLLPITVYAIQEDSPLFVQLQGDNNDPDDVNDLNGTNDNTNPNTNTNTNNNGVGNNPNTNNNGVDNNPNPNNDNTNTNNNNGNDLLDDDDDNDFFMYAIIGLTGAALGAIITYFAMKRD